MGSGTTIGEAHKLGCTAIGRDINPVTYHLAKIALSEISRQKLIKLFNLLREQVEKDLLALYKSADSNGNPCDVLYYFWVKYLPCPSCSGRVDLFSTYIFASHTYPKKHPQVQIFCPQCNGIFTSNYDATEVKCPDCALTFNPQEGCTDRTKAKCPHCRVSFPIAKTALAQGHPPRHRMYAKLVLRQNGHKEYLRITEDDLDLYEAVKKRLQQLNPPLPHISIEPGYNTQQVINYGYRYWDEMFNERQLLALSMLASAIKKLPACPEREVLMLLFSGTLEFNNMFASYKGEGTGAVRHMFSHHILKPERMPIEANLWGTDKSSGSFSTLFRSRIVRALDYKEKPFEIAVKANGKTKTGKKIFGINQSIGSKIIDTYPAQGLTSRSIYLSCGSSANTDLPAESIDVVVTDPPFFDNVHYAELADFFYVWQRLYFDEPRPLDRQTTRHVNEVQDTDENVFAQKLANVFSECFRVLRNDGLLIFSYHHSREDGWISVAKAVLSSDFSFVQSQPVKAEMSVATPKSQAKNPIDLDIILVCRKRSQDKRSHLRVNEAFTRACQVASMKIKRFNKLARTLSLNDIKVIFYSQLLVELSPGRSGEEFIGDFNNVTSSSSSIIKNMWEGQTETLSESRQLSPLQHFSAYRPKTEPGPVVTLVSS